MHDPKLKKKKSYARTSLFLLNMHMLAARLIQRLHSMKYSEAYAVVSYNASIFYFLFFLKIYNASIQYSQKRIYFDCLL